MPNRRTWKLVLFVLISNSLAFAQQKAATSPVTDNFRLTTYSITATSAQTDTFELNFHNYNLDTLSSIQFSLLKNEYLETVELQPKYLAMVPPDTGAKLQLILTPNVTHFGQNTDLKIQVKGDGFSSEVPLYLVIRPPKNYWLRIGLITTAVLISTFVGLFFYFNKKSNG